MIGMIFDNVILNYFLFSILGVYHCGIGLHVADSLKIDKTKSEEIGFILWSLCIVFWPVHLLVLLILKHYLPAAKEEAEEKING